MKPVAIPPAVAASDDALAGAELVDRPVEDDQRQDVALLERRVLVSASCGACRRCR